MNPSPMMRDTRTSEQKRIAALEKLCQKQHEALEITQFGFNHRRCSLCGGWNMSPNGETDGVHTKDCVIAKALTAYTTLFPQTGGAK